MMEFAAPSIILSALFSSFLTVKLVKGSWTRNPQYLVLSIIGGAIAMTVLNTVSPGSADDFILGNVAAFAGAAAGIFAFDAAIGMA
jgi:hypothetical protein